MVCQVGEVLVMYALSPLFLCDLNALICGDTTRVEMYCQYVKRQSQCEGQSRSVDYSRSPVLPTRQHCQVRRDL